MMLILNGSTPRIPILMVDATDDETAETGLTPTVQISKNGGSFADTSNSAVEVGNGWYYVALTATETNTDGPLLVRATGTGSDEYRDYHQVYTNVAANVTQFGGTNGTFASGRPEVNTTHAAGTAWNSGAIGADTLAADTLTAAKVASDVGTEIGTAVWATAARTLTALDEDNTTLDLDATIRTAVGLASANLDTQLGTIDGNVDAILVDTGTTLPATLSTIDGNVDSILEDTGTTLPATLTTIAGYIDTEVAAIKAVTDNLPDSGALTSLAQASELATVDSNVDAIKAKTDSLTFTVAGQVDANTKSMNDTTVDGTGTSEDKWRGAT
jgi:hypothetical protein